MRRLNGQNEKDLESESGLCGVMRKYETKQVPWVNKRDDENI